MEVLILWIGGARPAWCEDFASLFDCENSSAAAADANDVTGWETPEADRLRDRIVHPRTAQCWFHERPDSSQRRFELRGRINTDFIAADQSAANQATFGDLPDVVGLRRARIGAQGHFTPDASYVVEIDLASGEAVLRDGWLQLASLERGAFKFGHMREPFSLEGGTSANSFAFMERSSINQLDPARNWGGIYTRYSEAEDATLAVGVFAAGTDASDIQFQDGSTTNLTARLTRLAWYDDDGARLMHFGLVLSERVANQGIIQIRQKPGSPLLTFGDSSDSPFVATQKISAGFQQLINLQWAYVDGPFWSQAEWYGSVIDQHNGGPIFYHGSHLDAGYFLTGEHRGYVTRAGTFGAVTVNRPLLRRFAAKSRKAAERPQGYGAWELTGRLAYLDFMDSDTPPGPAGQPVGVSLPQATLGLNWHPADRLQIMFNYTYSAPHEINTGTSSASVLGSRLAVFW